MAEEKNLAESPLTPSQAINILVQGVHLGQKSGVYSLEDAALIKKAIDVFVKKEDGGATEDQSKKLKLAGVEGEDKEKSNKSDDPQD